MLGWLVGLIFPACAFQGAAGLPAPMPIDFAVLERPATPNTALAASPGLVPGAPDIVLADFPVSAQRLRDALVVVAAMQPRVHPHASTNASDVAQDHFVARSALLNFPDLVTAQVFARGENQAGLVLYSRSVYGRSDLGANRARLETWLGALANQLRT
jgi:uncharacterized protein (DUF1499 family)